VGEGGRGVVGVPTVPALRRLRQNCLSHGIQGEPGQHTKKKKGSNTLTIKSENAKSNKNSLLRVRRLGATF
jgi:hypothetical protein